MGSNRKVSCVECSTDAGVAERSKALVCKTSDNVHVGWNPATCSMFQLRHGLTVTKFAVLMVHA
ncbi:hypothetical protein BN2475_50136 [Paraburkholderia ribeironis]|uniref:Uncharacterized protein n=1 Tax=Paraburkholderia ribeironis TaxID=1247936 RepID=A0A1N7RKJ8_9BURK|nr:hypothetical protein BN2475_50136 [Paraburkholderia ribeironis]